MSGELRDTEPVVLLTNGKGNYAAVPASVAVGIAARLRKLRLMRERGIGADEAEAIIRREMAAEQE